MVLNPPDVKPLPDSHGEQQGSQKQRGQSPFSGRADFSAGVVDAAGDVPRSTLMSGVV
jgi:hypothetical protein